MGPNAQTMIVWFDEAAEITPEMWEELKEMARRRKLHEPSIAQHEATMNNLALANLARLKEIFRKLNRPTFLSAIKRVDYEFRATLKDKS